MPVKGAVISQRIPVNYAAVIKMDLNVNTGAEITARGVDYIYSLNKTANKNRFYFGLIKADALIRPGQRNRVASGNIYAVSAVMKRLIAGITQAEGVPGVCRVAPAALIYRHSRFFKTGINKQIGLVSGQHWNSAQEESRQNQRKNSQRRG